MGSWRATASPSPAPTPAATSSSGRARRAGTGLGSDAEHAVDERVELRWQAPVEVGVLAEQREVVGPLLRLRLAAQLRVPEHLLEPAHRVLAGRGGRGGLLRRFLRLLLELPQVGELGLERLHALFCAL